MSRILSRIVESGRYSFLSATLKTRVGWPPAAAPATPARVGRRLHCLSPPLHTCDLVSAIPVLSCNHTSYRNKQTSSKKNTEDEDAEDWNEDDRSLTRDSKVMQFRAQSTRLDLVLKAALGIARNKIEKVFYDSKLRLNGCKVLKKSVQVHVGDEIDVVKGFSPKNPDHILVSRVEILDMKTSTTEDDEPVIIISARRFKTLLIENYDQDTYKESTAASD